MHHTHSSLSRRQLLVSGAAAVGGGILASGLSSKASSRYGSPTVMAQGELTRVSYGTNWFAQAEHGGFYQAIAAGIYQDYGLDVTIQMGGPGINITQVLAGGAADFAMGGSAGVTNAVAEGIPLICVASMFQKDPQVLMAHPGTTNFEDLAGRPIYVSTGGLISYWPYLRARYGFTDEQIRPYNFNPGPFLADPTSAQQGYLTSEPFAVEREGGFVPEVFLLADLGFQPYSTTIETTRRLVEQDPDLVQRFVDASILGWYSFLEDPDPAYELIQIDNPEMSDEQLAYSFEKMEEFGIIVSGEAETLGIGAMTDQRWETFYNDMAEVGVFDFGPDFDIAEAYTLEFVNKGVGLS